MERGRLTKARAAAARPRKSRAEKVSISLQADDLAWLRARAKRKGGNLSAELAEATRLLRQQEAGVRLVAMFGDDAKMTPEEAEAIRREWDGPEASGSRPARAVRR